MHFYLALAGILPWVVLLLHFDVSSASMGMGSESMDSSFIPVLASGKRQHNIMRFGKRPAPGHNLIHFGKRDVSDLLDYFQQRNRGDSSYKRGHSIMRFGKRADSHNFIRFGKRDDGFEDSDDKRTANGHSMMYFGKRGKNGHSMMYFGKRGTPNGHNMMYFGKRDDVVLYPIDENEEEKRAAHSMIHFGKREMDDGKRSHAMIHFGKREAEGEDDNEVEDESGDSTVKRQHNLLRFGKKNDRKGSHAMIHFGKREVDDDKRSHAMIHFGKRSDDEGVVVGNQSEAQGVRMKREAGPYPGTLVRYENEEESPSLEGMSEPVFYDPTEGMEDWDPNSEEYLGRLDKKDTGRNAFLRFG